MKVIFNKFYYVMILLLGAVNAFAGKGGGSGPPSPTAKAADGPGPPPPPGLSVDENILILFVVALVFGVYIIYKYILKEKKPV